MPEKTTSETAPKNQDHTASGSGKKSSEDTRRSSRARGTGGGARSNNGGGNNNNNNNNRGGSMRGNRNTSRTGGGSGGGGGNPRGGTNPQRNTGRQQPFDGNKRSGPPPARGTHHRGTRGNEGRNRPGTSVRTNAQRQSAPPRAPVRPRGIVTLPSMMTVREFSEATGIGAAEILKTLMSGGVIANINQQIDYETAAVIATEFDIETTEKVPEKFAEVVENIADVLAQQKPETMLPRPPVVTIMGHVDHGKTKLLDAIRSTHVAEGEAGGITQHIGAYQVEVHGRKITFLDTPGHEAFTAMRARGAQVTDIVILVVAADDGVMPQTVEAISHVKASGDPMIVAINKIDLAGANVDRVKQQLLSNGVVLEEYGGNVPSVEVSARQKINIDGLLEMILLVADLEDLRSNPHTQAVGTIVEAEMDKNRGTVATALIQNGTLRPEDTVLVGSVAGKVKMMFGDNGKRLRYAEPSTPVEILGLEDVPEAGDILQAMDDLQTAREIALQRQRQQRMEAIAAPQGMSLDDLFSKIQEGQVKDLNLILKADVQGSIGAIEHQLQQLNDTLSGVQLRVIHKGTGTITESDVNLAVVSKAIIIGFNARPHPIARKAAVQRGVDIRFYNVIYQLTEDIKKAMVGLLDPEYQEVIEGFAEVRNTFRLPSRETVAGLIVSDGKITRNLSVRVLRNGIVTHDGKIANIKRFKEDVREVMAGYECGLIVANFNDIEVGDTMEFYRKEQIQRVA
jgi:translation initiation factor IF-2